MEARGQTQLDFALGVSVLLVTIIGTLLFIQGGLFQSFDRSVDAPSQAQAERVASRLVENYTTEGNETILRYDRPDGSGIHDSLDADTGLTRLRGQAGLNVTSARRASPNLNVTVVNGTTLARTETRPATDASGDRLAWGEDVAGVSNPGTVIRVVRLENDRVPARGREICDPACWLVVRVW
jgi:hypothetical protein